MSGNHLPQCGISPRAAADDPAALLAPELQGIGGKQAFDPVHAVFYGAVTVLMASNNRAG